MNNRIDDRQVCSLVNNIQVTEIKDLVTASELRMHDKQFDVWLC